MLLACGILLPLGLATCNGAWRRRENCLVVRNRVSNTGQWYLGRFCVTAAGQQASWPVHASWRRASTKGGNRGICPLLVGSRQDRIRLSAGFGAELHLFLGSSISSDTVGRFQRHSLATSEGMCISIQRRIRGDKTSTCPWIHPHTQAKLLWQD
ncbi:hypothetical protein LZ32DRAFT_152208 [Colletotrichum eremochloae]|nr:hypothetical protein LZ32DRAFT_152208 [Colletotrichum eremochloae]